MGGGWKLLKAGVFLESTITASEVGNEVSAGLPNITGSMTFRPPLNQDMIKGYGVFTKGMSDTVWQNALSREHNPQNLEEVTFDASRSSSVYGRSSTVQPHSIRVYIWERTK